MSKLIPTYIEQALRIETLERAMIASEQDYERMKAAAQAAYWAMVAMELSDGSKREWEAAVDGLKAALAEQKPMLEMNPEKRPWVGLTDEEIDEIGRVVIGFNSLSGWENEFGLAIETKLREKNT